MRARARSPMAAIETLLRISSSVIQKSKDGSQNEEQEASVLRTVSRAAVSNISRDSTSRLLLARQHFSKCFSTCCRHARHASRTLKLQKPAALKPKTHAKPRNRTSEPPKPKKPNKSCPERNGKSAAAALLAQREVLHSYGMSFSRPKRNKRRTLLALKGLMRKPKPQKEGIRAYSGS